MDGLKRVHRVERLIAKNLSDILLREVNDPRVASMNISAVKVSKDLSHAKIYFTLLSSSEEDVDACSIALVKAKGYIRKLLAERINLRIVPQLDFQYDVAQIRGEHLENLIDAALLNTCETTQ